MSIFQAMLLHQPCQTQDGQNLWRSFSLSSYITEILHSICFASAQSTTFSQYSWKSCSIFYIFHCGWRKSSCLGRFRMFAKKLATLSHVDSTSTFSVLSGLSHIFWTLEILRAVFGVPLSSSYVCLLRGSLNASHCLCHGYWCIGYT